MEENKEFIATAPSENKLDATAPSDQDLDANMPSDQDLTATALSEDELAGIGGGAGNPKVKCKIGTIDEEKENLADLLLAEPGA